MYIDKTRFIAVTKIADVEEPKYESKFLVGETKRGYFTKLPEVGEPFMISERYTTSDVVELLSEDSFRTLNSIFKFRIY